MPPLQSLYCFRKVLSKAELNLFGNLIWLNESMVICLSNFVTCSKWLTLLQREVKCAGSDSVAYGTEQLCPMSAVSPPLLNYLIFLLGLLS